MVITGSYHLLLSPTIRTVTGSTLSLTPAQYEIPAKLMEVTPSEFPRIIRSLTQPWRLAIPVAHAAYDGAEIYFETMLWSDAVPRLEWPSVGGVMDGEVGK